MPTAGRSFPDRNCNVELYCNDRVIELETLAPLVRLEPGQEATHMEEWELYADLEQIPSEMRRSVRTVLD